MTFSVRKEPSGVVVVEIEGRLVVSNRQELKGQVLEAIEGGARKFIVDFSGTAYIDSPGLGVLVSVSKAIREAGGQLRLSCLNDDIRELFELAKLDTLFSVAETTEQALETL